nr:hypothetical protein [Streptomyces yokosukanensis]
MPFQGARLRLPEGSSLVLCTDDVVQGRQRDITTGLTALRTALTRTGRTPQQTCQEGIAHWDIPLRPRRRLRRPGRRHPAARRVGRAGSHVGQRGAHHQRTGHQCHPQRHRSDHPAPAVRPRAHLGSLRYQQHRTPPKNGRRTGPC